MIKKLHIGISLLLVFSMFSLIIFSGCSSQNSAEGDFKSGKPKVVSTTTMIHDLVKSIAQDEIDATCLMKPGIDPHSYKASAGDVTKMQDADVIVYNGLHLEGKMGEIFSALESYNKTVICIENGLDKSKLLPVENSNSIYDPHIWFSVPLWKDAAIYVTKQLSSAFPHKSQLFQENLEYYLLELEQLHLYTEQRVQALSKEQRILVTAHDAFQYLGITYGFEVKGIQGISTAAEASTNDITELSNYIVEHKINAVFLESSVAPKTIESLQEAVLARSFNVTIGGELFSDSLGTNDTGALSYVETVKANIDTIVNGLSKGGQANA